MVFDETRIFLGPDVGPIQAAHISAFDFEAIFHRVSVFFAFPFQAENGRSSLRMEIWAHRFAVAHPCAAADPWADSGYIVRAERPSASANIIPFLAIAIKQTREPERFAYWPGRIILWERRYF
jgi:hypothetical protein